MKTSWVKGHRGFSPKVEFKRVSPLAEFMHWKNSHGSVSLKWLVILSEFVTEKVWIGWISHNIFHGQEKFIGEFISHWSSL